MGTVSGALETTHFSEKVHLVVARKAKFTTTAVLKFPEVNMQVVEQQGVAGTARDYNTTAVSDHIQRMEVTKTAQQIETVLKRAKRSFASKKFLEAFRAIFRIRPEPFPAGWLLLFN